MWTVPTGVPSEGTAPGSAEEDLSLSAERTATHAVALPTTSTRSCARAMTALGSRSPAMTAAAAFSANVLLYAAGSTPSSAQPPTPSMTPNAPSSRRTKHASSPPFSALSGWGTRTAPEERTPRPGEAEAGEGGGGRGVSTDAGASEASDARVSAANRRRAGDAPGTRRERATIPPRNRWGARRASPPGGRRERANRRRRRAERRAHHRRRGAGTRRGGARRARGARGRVTRRQAERREAAPPARHHIHATSSLITNS